MSTALQTRLCRVMLLTKLNAEQGTSCYRHAYISSHVDIIMDTGGDMIYYNAQTRHQLGQDRGQPTATCAVSSCAILFTIAAAVWSPWPVKRSTKRGPASRPLASCDKGITASLAVTLPAQHSRCLLDTAGVQSCRFAEKICAARSTMQLSRRQQPCQIVIGYSSIMLLCAADLL